MQPSPASVSTRQSIVFTPLPRKGPWIDFRGAPIELTEESCAKVYHQVLECFDDYYSCWWAYQDGNVSFDLSFEVTVYPQKKGVCLRLDSELHPLLGGNLKDWVYVLPALLRAVDDRIAQVTKT